MAIYSHNSFKFIGCATILLSDALDKDKAWILANPKEEISNTHIEKLAKLLNRRAMHEPLAYIRKHCEFYNREFIVTVDVMQPRPESETIIEELLLVIEEGRVFGTQEPILHISDVGTGSGILGITAALEIPKSEVELLEINEKAAAIAKSNVDLFTLKISVKKSDLLQNASSKIDVILANLPYVPDEYEINTAAQYEPHIALFGGPDGLNIYRKLFIEAAQYTYKPLLIIIEAFPFQHEKLREIAKKSKYKLYRSQDFIQLYILA